MAEPETVDTGHEPMVGTAEVAKFLGKAPHTLDQWASRGVGPRHYRVGGHRRYRMSDVLAWIEANASDSPTGI